MKKEPEKPGEAEILAWLQPWFPRRAKLDPDDILGSLGYAGDDAHELMQGFCDRFGVDPGGVEPWLYYLADEPPVYRRWHAVDPETGAELPFFPISEQDLVAAAKAGVWTKTHPPHRFKENPFRIDLKVLLRVIAAALVFIMLAGLIEKLTR